MADVLDFFEEEAPKQTTVDNNVLSFFEDEAPVVEQFFEPDISPSDPPPSPLPPQEESLSVGSFFADEPTELPEDFPPIAPFTGARAPASIDAPSLTEELLAPVKKLKEFITPDLVIDTFRIKHPLTGERVVVRSDTDLRFVEGLEAELFVGLETPTTFPAKNNNELLPEDIAEVDAINKSGKLTLEGFFGLSMPQRQRVKVVPSMTPEEYNLLPKELLQQIAAIDALQATETDIVITNFIQGILPVLPESELPFEREPSLVGEVANMAGNLVTIMTIGQGLKEAGYVLKLDPTKLSPLFPFPARLTKEAVNTATKLGIFSTVQEAATTSIAGFEGRIDTVGGLKRIGGAALRGGKGGLLLGVGGTLLADVLQNVARLPPFMKNRVQDQLLGMSLSLLQNPQDWQRATREGLVFTLAGALFDSPKANLLGAARSAERFIARSPLGTPKQKLRMMADLNTVLLRSPGSQRFIEEGIAAGGESKRAVLELLKRADKIRISVEKLAPAGTFTDVLTVQESQLIKEIGLNLGTPELIKPILDSKGRLITEKVPQNRVFIEPTEKPHIPFGITPVEKRTAAVKAPNLSGVGSEVLEVELPPERLLKTREKTGKTFLQLGQETVRESIRLAEHPGNKPFGSVGPNLRDRYFNDLIKAASKFDKSLLVDAITATSFNNRGEHTKADSLAETVRSRLEKTPGVFQRWIDLESRGVDLGSIVPRERAGHLKPTVDGLPIDAPEGIKSQPFPGVRTGIEFNPPKQSEFAKEHSPSKVVEKNLLTDSDKARKTWGKKPDGLMLIRPWIESANRLGLGDVAKKFATGQLLFEIDFDNARQYIGAQKQAWDKLYPGSEIEAKSKKRIFKGKEPIESQAFFELIDNPKFTPSKPPPNLTPAQVEVYRNARFTTDLMLERANSISRELGLPEIKTLSGYIMHMFDPRVFAELPADVQKEINTLLRKGGKPPNPTRRRRLKPDEGNVEWREENLIRDPWKALEVMSRYDLREAHLKTPFLFWEQFKAVHKKDIPKETMTWFEDLFLRHAVLRGESPGEERFNNLKTVQDVNNLLETITGQPINNTARKLGRIYGRAVNFQKIWMNIPLVTLNHLQKIQLTGLYPYKHIIDALPANPKVDAFLHNSVYWKSTLKAGGMEDIGNLKGLAQAAERAGYTAFASSHNSNVETAFRAGYYAAKNQGWTQSEAVAEGIFAARTTQYWYHVLGMPQVFSSAGGRATMKLMSWPMNGLTVFLPAMRKRLTQGVTPAGKKIPLSWQAGLFRYMGTALLTSYALGEAGLASYRRATVYHWIPTEFETFSTNLAGALKDITILTGQQQLLNLMGVTDRKLDSRVQAATRQAKGALSNVAYKNLMKSLEAGDIRPFVMYAEDEIANGNAALLFKGGLGKKVKAPSFKRIGQSKIGKGLGKALGGGR